jgi:excisionase family DNA binding protein
MHRRYNMKLQAGDLITIRQAAEIIGVDKQTVYRLIAKGRLPVVKFGPRLYRIHRADLEEIVERRKQKQINNALPAQ